MPSYKTHSIHAEEVFKSLDRKTNIDKESMKVFAMGPDALISSDYSTFDKMHKENVKEYFMSLLKAYKEKKLLDNPEAMSFLYGQLDHYMLDASTHPLIYYLTEKCPKEGTINMHGLVEMWIDAYYMRKYNSTEKKYYHKSGIKDRELMLVIDEVTNRIYGSKNVSSNYNKGIKLLSMYDLLARNNLLGIVPIVEKVIGPITFKNGISRVEPFLNEDHSTWLNPETGELLNESFDDLFNKAKDNSLELIHDVDSYLYNDKPLKNYFINSDISYNTGLSCSRGQLLTYCKEYSEKERKLNKEVVETIIGLTPVILTYISCMISKGSMNDIDLLSSVSGASLVALYNLINENKTRESIKRLTISK